MRDLKEMAAIKLPEMEIMMMKSQRFASRGKGSICPDIIKMMGWLAIGLLGFTFSLSVWSLDGWLNDTGQASCYDLANVVADCTVVASDQGDLPGQDGRYGRDIGFFSGEWSKVSGGLLGFDFTKICGSGQAAGTGTCPHDPVIGTGVNQWLCTRDNRTGLIWSRPVVSSLTWEQAMNDELVILNSHTICGSTTWRVPSRRELLSIVHYGAQVEPAIDTVSFPDTPHSIWYWTRDENVLNLDNAVVVSFKHGTDSDFAKTNHYHVRFVHGSYLPSSSFTENDDGTVTDEATGLIWDKCSWGQSGADCSIGTATRHYWADALRLVVSANADNYKGYDDWRLPNLTELESLTDIAKSNAPFIDTSVFPNVGDTGLAFYASSTSNSINPEWVHFVTFGFPTDSRLMAKDTYTFNVRLVRGGGTAGFDSLADTVPDAFSFASETNVELSSVITAAPITISGINKASPVSISECTGSDCAYFVEDDEWRSDLGTVRNGQKVWVRQTSSGYFSTATALTLDIGGVTSTFNVVTEEAITTPDPFAFSAQVDVERDTLITSNTITVTGINTESPVSILTCSGTGCEYSIDGGGWTSSAGTVSSGQSMAVRLLSSSEYAVSNTLSLDVGGVSALFTVTTKDDDGDTGDGSDTGDTETPAVSSGGGGGAAGFGLLGLLGMAMLGRRRLLLQG